MDISEEREKSIKSLMANYCEYLIKLSNDDLLKMIKTKSIKLEDSKCSTLITD
jgi:hypothetical protein